MNAIARLVGFFALLWLVQRLIETGLILPGLLIGLLVLVFALSKKTSRTPAPRPAPRHPANRARKGPELVHVLREKGWP